MPTSRSLKCSRCSPSSVRSPTYKVVHLFAELDLVVPLSSRFKEIKVGVLQNWNCRWENQSQPYQGSKPEATHGPCSCPPPCSRNICTKWQEIEENVNPVDITHLQMDRFIISYHMCNIYLKLCSLPDRRGKEETSSSWQKPC